ncbi:hypothetical protein [Pseudonocardia sp. T1-2H]|uniref:hypothetical protein n=1 Tax=Pseudonocardia sp. T1-2H TaxID=3128899 RepID=UPI0031016B0B
MPWLSVGLGPVRIGGRVRASDAGNAMKGLFLLGLWPLFLCWWTVRFSWWVCVWVWRGLAWCGRQLAAAYRACRRRAAR